MDLQRMQERTGLYSLLHALYTYPLQPAVLDAVVQLELPLASPESAGLSQMQARLRGNGVPPATLEALNTEMTRLLEGPGLTPAPPYASYYLNAGQLMGPPAAAARRTYLEWQVAPAGQAHLPEDHVALELGFLAYLAAQSVQEQDAGLQALEASRDFLRHQVMSWLPRFCAALSSAAADPFFSGLARFTQAAVEADLAWLEEALANLPAAADSSTLPRG